MRVHTKLELIVFCKLYHATNAQETISTRLGFNDMHTFFFKKNTQNN